MTTFKLPQRGRGRQSAEAEARYLADLSAFCGDILQIQSTLDFKVSSRGWCYLLEGRGLLDKGSFDRAQELINDCRKSGLLPVDICADDAAREWRMVEQIDLPTTGGEAQRIVNTMNRWVENYLPFSFWDDKPVYIQMMVEKIDLRELFAPVCERYRVPIANGRGWSDINTRADMMQRFKRHEAAGRRCVLLYCGDHDPGGLAISDAIRQNLADMAAAVGWRPDNLIIDRFGLNHDFIVANNLPWIDNLITSSGKSLGDLRHPDHYKPHVQSYLAKYGVRKVEANALVIIPQEGRKLCEDSILRWLGDSSAPERFETKLAPARTELAQVLAELLRMNGGAE